MIRVQNLSYGYTKDPLYENVNFTIGGNQKVGLVGPNGAGKSTLLKIILGSIPQTSGTIETIGSIGYVPQEVKHDKDLELSPQVIDYVDPKREIPQYEIEMMFRGLGLEAKLDDNPQKFSGGQKTKIALAKALLTKPSVLLLDEPTNFMDQKGKEWVMRFLSDYPHTVLVISHDLPLLDKQIQKILFVSPQTKSVDEYKGNYTSFLKLKEERERTLKKQILVKEKHIKRMEEGLTKMTRFTSGKGVRRRVMQQRRIAQEKAKLPEMPKELASIRISLPEPANVGELVLKVVDFKKSYPETGDVITKLNFSILRGERIALIGPNGSGKSTLIKILVGLSKQDSGELITHPQLKIGYYSQEFELFDFTKTVIDTFCDKTKKDEGYARNFLGRFLLAKDKVFQRVESLSGGEKTRLSIAILTACDFNFLVLDEPTTYLDVMSQRIILEALKSYKGAMLLVSHTEEFVKEISPKKAILMPDQKATIWRDELLHLVGDI
jgi:ATP-binding cassette, subfamily F, member 3